MATLFKNHTKEKLFGQIYTPDFIVKKILDDVGYINENILEKKILDPACGDGRFLCEIVRRIILYSPSEKIAHNLSYVYGYDIDNNAINECISNLNAIVSEYTDAKINWNIYCCDTLKKIENVNNIFSNENFIYFDYIVGNPPYIRIQHLDEDQRKFIQRNYSFCRSGSTDIFIAFFEFSFLSLKPTGICGFITPNTYFTTETAKDFRKFLETNQYIVKITNYGEIQLFDNATTYS
ncbi:MAG TPA: N-6 DNA methylase, partial [bacterium]|nr:N-6 DNA methylase [bacterium]